MSIKKDSYKKFLKPIISIIVIFVIFREVSRQISSIDMALTLSIIMALEPNEVFILTISGIFLFTKVCLYDVAVSYFYNFDISSSKAAKIGYISTSFNNMIGLGGIGGASMRSYLYGKYNMDLKKVVPAAAIIVLSSLCGLSVLSILALLGIFDVTVFIDGYEFFYAVLLGFSLYSPIYLFLNKIPYIGEKLLPQSEKSSLKLRLRLVAISSLDRLLAALFFYVAVLHVTGDTRLFLIMGLYTISITLGIASFVPSGAGSFDLAAIFGLTLLGHESSEALASIIVFRTFYYILPFMTSLILLLSEVRKKKDILVK